MVYIKGQQSADIWSCDENISNAILIKFIFALYHIIGELYLIIINTILKYYVYYYL